MSKTDGVEVSCLGSRLDNAFLGLGSILQCCVRAAAFCSCLEAMGKRCEETAQSINTYSDADEFK